MIGTADYGEILNGFASGIEMQGDSNHSNPIVRFAENFVVLPSGDPFRISKTPYAAGIYDAMADFTGEAKVVAIGKGAQMGMTTAAANFTLYTIAELRSPILFLLEDIKKAETLWRERVAPSFDRPPLDSILHRERQKGSRGATYRATYEGGSAVLAGSHSKSSYSGVTARVVIADEYARYPQVVGTAANPSGDPLFLLRNRMNALGSRGKIVLLSTPLDPYDVPGSFSNTMQRGDMRVYKMPCIHCGHMGAWSEETFGYAARDNTISAWHTCGKCQKKQREEHKTAMMSDGRARWVATKERDVGSDVVSFHLPSFLSPTDWISFHEIARRAIEVDRQQASIQVLKNEIYAVPYSPAITPPPEEAVAERWTLPIERGVVPGWVRFLTAAVDVQRGTGGAGWVSWSVYGWGDNGLSFLVETGEYDGGIEERRTHAALRRLFYSRWPCEGGGSLPILLGGVDCGDQYTAVTDFTARFYQPYRAAGSRAPVWTIPSAPCVMPVKGSGRREQKGALDYVGRPVAKARVGGRPMCVATAGVDIIKHDLYTALSREPEFEERDVAGTATPYSNFFPQGLEAAVFEELTSEEARTTISPSGAPITKFKKKNDMVRNEKLDVFCYARCAAEMIGLSSLGTDGLQRLYDSHWRREGAVGLGAQETAEADKEDIVPVERRGEGGDGEDELPVERGDDDDL